MTEDLEEIKERLGSLEGYVELLESRVDWQERMMKLHNAGIKPVATRGADDDPRPSPRDALKARPTGLDSQLHEVDDLLRSILAKQDSHNREIRRAVRNQEGLLTTSKGVTARLDSIAKDLRHVDRIVQELVNRLEARSRTNPVS